MRQHRIPDPAPITNDMSSGAVGASPVDLVGRAVVTAYNVPDTRRGDVLLLLDNGTVLGVSCDPITHDDECNRLPPEKWGEEWEAYWMDATDTAAGRAIKNLEPGEWF